MQPIRTLAAIMTAALASGVAASAAPTPALTTGRTLYQEACAYCHGANGQGGVRQSAPKLWGTGNIISLSAYGTSTPLTQYIRQYMPTQPVNGINPGSLTKAQAQSLARFILGGGHG